VSDPHMLEGKRAVIFGAAGSIGAAVASEFAAEGAKVFLAGRTFLQSDPSVTSLRYDASARSGKHRSCRPQVHRITPISSGMIHSSRRFSDA
jgi:NAD(P)-dependent dehydrogenase (short-subunit alcohol dehydrogenase family)